MAETGPVDPPLMIGKPENEALGQGQVVFDRKSSRKKFSKQLSKDSEKLSTQITGRDSRKLPDAAFRTSTRERHLTPEKPESDITGKSQRHTLLDALQGHKHSGRPSRRRTRHRNSMRTIGEIPVARLGDLVIGPKVAATESIEPKVANTKPILKQEWGDEFASLVLKNRDSIVPGMHPPEITEEEEEDPVMSWWRIFTRGENDQLQTYRQDQFDYFVSHAWQPPPGFTNVKFYVQQKVQALEMFGRRQALFGGPTGVKPEPHFLLEPYESTSPGGTDPADDWRSYKCWVDKACARGSVLAPRSDLENTSVELIRATKSALGACRNLLAVVSLHFFSRLWCILEYATFLIDVAPAYRRLDFVIHESLMMPLEWNQIVNSVSTFSLGALRCGTDMDHPELWRELEVLVVSSDGFERFIQATAFALLTRHLLLRCQRHCYAFGSDEQCSHNMNVIFEACTKLKLHGLARAVHSACPRHWWSLAFQRARDELQGDSLPQDSSQSKQNRSADTDAKEKPPKASNVPEPLEVLETKIAEKLRHRARTEGSKSNHPSHVLANEDSVKAAEVAMQTLQHREQYRDLFKPGAARNLVQDKLQKICSKGEDEQASRSFVAHGNTPVSPTKAVQADCEKDTVASMQKAIGGLPDGFSPFWRGATGHTLTDIDRQRARLFRKAWMNYSDYVNRWFDKYVCPYLEVWRQRGVRSPGLLEETFGSMLMTVDGSFQQSLCDQLAPGLREVTLAAEAPPRGRPGRPCQAPWANPTLDRLLVVSSGKGHDFPGSLGARKYDSKGCKIRVRVSFSDAEFPEEPSQEYKVPEPPAILLSPLGMELREQSSHMLLRLTFGEGAEAHTVTLPQRLGVEALVNAFRQVLHGGQQHQQTQITTLEMEAIIPRTSLYVYGSEHSQVELGMRFVGTLRAAAVQDIDLKDAVPALTAAVSRRTLAAEASLAVTPGRDTDINEPPDDSDSETSSDSDELESIDWNRWRCRDIVSVDSTPTPVDFYCTRQNDTKNEPENPFMLEDVASRPSGYPSPGLTPRRDRALAALYVSYIDDTAGPSLTPRRVRAGALSPLSNALLQKARSQLRLDDVPEHNVSDTIAKTPRRKHQGPGGLLPPKAIESPRQYPQMSELMAATPRRLKPFQPLLRGPNKSLPEEEPRDEPSVVQEAPSQVDMIHLVSFWEWTARTHGGPPEAARQLKWTGTIQEIFQRLDEWVAKARRSGCPYCVPVNNPVNSVSRAISPSGSPQPSRTGGALIPDKRALATPFEICRSTTPSEGELPARQNASIIRVAPPPLARSKACSRCQHTDVARVSLEGSMLGEIWQTTSCRICLRCGSVVPATAETSRDDGAISGDSVLEVTTSIMLKAGQAAEVQQRILRVLRIHHGTVSVAAPHMNLDPSSTRAKPSVAYVSLMHRATGVVAAAACSHRYRPARRGSASARSSVRFSTFAQSKPCGNFSRDLDWAQGSLFDAGLDLVYGISKPIPINFAISELDDTRTLPRRKDVCPLVLWAELAHVLSPSFDPNTWIHATVQVCCHGKFSLPGAIMLRSHSGKLRKAILMSHPYKKNTDSHDEPKDWPLALHRVLVTREGASDALLGVALRGTGIMASSPEELFQQGLLKLAGLHADSKAPSVRRSSIMTRVVSNNCKKDDGKAVKNQVMDAAAVMHELVYRRLTGDAHVGERALLRARRVLRHIQVVEFLDSWHERLTEDDGWRNASFFHNPSEQTQRDMDDDDEIFAEYSDSSDECDSDKEDSVENLLLQKVLGHIKEYVHHRDVAQKAWTIVNIIVQTCSKFCESTSVFRQRRNSLQNVNYGLIEQKILDQGLVRAALRTLYRHHSRPDICSEVFKMLLHLLKPIHRFAPRTISELSSPPLNVFTLIMSLCHFSEATRPELVSNNIRVLNLLFSKDASEMPPPLPADRYEEAADALIPILYRHEGDMNIVLSLLQLFVGMVRDSEMCCAFFNRGLNDVLRLWLLDSIEGKQLVLWVKEKESQLGGARKTTLTGRGAAGFRKRAGALNHLNHQAATCETMCWDLIRILTNGSTRCENYLEDSYQTIIHGLKEMVRQPRSRQWHLATECLTKMLLHDRDSHAARLVAAGALSAISPEFPDGEVKEVIPLLIAILDESKQLDVPKKQPGESDDEDEGFSRKSRASHIHFKSVGVDKEDMAMSSASEEEEDSEKEPQEPQEPQDYKTPETPRKTLGLGGATKKARKMMAFAAAMKKYKPQAEDLSGATLMYRAEMIDKSKGWLIAHKFVCNALRSMFKDYQEFTWQVRNIIMRLLAALFIPRYSAADESVDQLYLQSRAAVTEFEIFGEEYGGGLLSVLNALKCHLSNAELVDSAMYLLIGAFDMFNRIAERVGDLEGFPEILVDAAWKHVQNQNTRRRVLIVLRKVREAKPSITLALSELWQERQQRLEGLEPLPFERDSSKDEQHDEIRRRRSDGQMPEEGSDPLANKSNRPPGDMVRFGAVLQVHSFYLEHGQRPLSEALEPLDKYTKDWEICAVALSGITLGSKMEMQNRYSLLQKMPNFALIARRAVETYSEPEAFNPVLQLVTGVLGTNPMDKEELVETCAVAVRAALENLDCAQYNNEPSWVTAESWEQLLEAIETAARVPCGKEKFAEHEIKDVLHEVWAHMEASEKDEDKAVVKLHKGATVFVMELLT